MPQTLPVIDVSSAFATGSYDKTAAEIGRAAREVGFFYLAGHGIEPALISAVFAEAARFFAAPEIEKEKLSIKLSPHNRGYVAIEGESLDPTKPPDLKEAYNIGLDLAPDDPRVVAGKPFFGVNLWPDLPGWRGTMLAYFDAIWAVGRKLHRAIALDVGQPEAFFEDKLDEPMATLRLLHYPPQPQSAAAGQLGAGEHTDYGNMTFLLTDEVGGLEVKKRGGGWIPAPHRPGMFVCNIGDCLMRWTNDVYVSTPHRVLNRGGRERYSVAFFLDPNPGAEVACLPSCVSGTRPARYPPIDGAAFLRQRLDATYAFRQPVET